jgi:hypothetical protein
MTPSPGTPRPWRKTLRSESRGVPTGRRPREAQANPPRRREPNAFAVAYAEAQTAATQPA